MDVLVIEDHEECLDWMSRLLRDAGYRVHEAADEDEGLWLLRTRGARLVIASLGSTVSDDLIAAVKREQPCVKVLAVSSERPGVPAQGAARTVGAEEVLAKPFSAAALTASVRRLTPDAPVA